MPRSGESLKVRVPRSGEGLKVRVQRSGEGPKVDRRLNEALLWIDGGVSNTGRSLSDLRERIMQAVPAKHILHRNASDGIPRFRPTRSSASRSNPAFLKLPLAQQFIHFSVFF